MKCIKPENSRYICKGCNQELNYVFKNDYVICGNCNSVLYISDDLAEKDNNEYFDTVYGNGLREELKNRVELFNYYHKKDTYFHKASIDKFCTLETKCDNLITKAPISIEIGFGYGTQLSRYLEAGANMFGVEISNEAVNYFKATYPDKAGRVFVSDTIPFDIDVAFGNALFEHLDDPDIFLNNVGEKLNNNGYLILRLPIFFGSIRDREKICFDINFWKPCHRALYSLNGLSLLLKRHGFTIHDCAMYNYYGYRVMNSMLKAGYSIISRLRNPFLNIEGLESDWKYRLILFKGFFQKCFCKDTIVIAKHVSQSQ